MISLHSISKKEQPARRVPRMDSLLHRLQRAKNSEGQPIPLWDELIALLDDPPSGVTDRWEAGAEFCGRHGIKTSRMGVWRAYREHLAGNAAHFRPLRRITPGNSL